MATQRVYEREQFITFITLVRKKTPQVNLQNLRQKADEYQIELQNKCHALHDEVEGPDIDSWFQKITDTITQIAMKVAGKETHTKAEKLSEETLKMLKKRRELKKEKGNQRI